MEIDGVIHVALRKGTFFVYSMESISNQQKKHNLKGVSVIFYKILPPLYDFQYLVVNKLFFGL